MSTSTSLLYLLRKSVEKFVRSAGEVPEYFHLTNLPQSAESIAGILRRARWQVIDAQAEDKFVTSDAPVSTMELTPNQKVIFGCGFSNDTAAVVLPLTPEKTFVAFQKSWEGLEPTSEGIVLATIQFAHRNVYSSFKSERLRTMVNEQINTVVFGENAFV